MPTYVYRREDGSTFELEQRISEDSLKTCPTTGQKVERLISATNFQLKGSGWYKTDYSSSTKSPASTPTNGSSAAPKTESTTSTTESKPTTSESKPAAKTAD